MPRHPPYEGDLFIVSDPYSMPLSDFKDARIGVEAVYYLQHIIDNAPAFEPLTPAIGGEPLMLKKAIRDELDLWTENWITPLFVFEGRSTVGKEEITLLNAKDALIKTEHAWELYSGNEARESVDAFAVSRAIRAHHLYPILQEVLVERGLDFIVAPLSACAQLAHIENLDAQYIDGIMGSQELLLYDIHDAVISPPTATAWEKAAFSGFSKSELIKKLRTTPEMFSDALLMIGTSFLRPFPPLQDESIISSQPFSVVDAINILNTTEQSVTNACAAFNDTLQLRDPDWLDKFRKAKLSVKHCATITEEGIIHISDYGHLTSDNIEYLGLQLPPELHHYFSRLLVGSRIMNCLSSLESIVFPTLDGVVSDEYKHLVTLSLVPIKETTIALIFSRIHRSFQFTNIKMTLWFDESFKKTLVHHNTQSHPNQQADTWGVKDSLLKTQEMATGTPAGTLLFALISLQEQEFPPRTISKKRVAGLKSKAEVISNGLWRLLHLRGYVDDRHTLTTWGNALATTLKNAGPSIKAYNTTHYIEEGAFIAYELIRYDILNSRNPRTELVGAPLRGLPEDKASCILIARIACLLKLRHAEIGYTGPLSQNLLAFYSMIKSVREASRDLLEAITVSMFLSNQADRERGDDEYRGLSLSLPFSRDIDIGFGIAVKTYLDDFLKLEWSAEERENKKGEYVENYLPFSTHFKEDLDVAFNTFDAIYEGIKTLGSEVSEVDKKAWDAAKDYLAKRR